MLLFIDNIFRYTQAGSEVSALLGRMPSAVGYQPTLADERWVHLQERITSTKNGSITSVQAVYVPADDLNRSGTGNNICPSGCNNCIIKIDSIVELGYLSGSRSTGIKLHVS